MKTFPNRVWSAVLVALLVVALVGCGEDDDVAGEATGETTADAVAEPREPEPAAAPEPVALNTGTYEAEWAMTPQMKPLLSLVVDDTGEYAFYVSIMGLAEEGRYETADDGTITFTPLSGEPHEGTFDAGSITTSFRLGEEPSEFTFTQVGSPDDVYESFVGDYLTSIMQGTLQVMFELKRGARYVNTLSGETGTFRIADGSITLTPEGDGDPIVGSFDLRSNTFTVTMSVMPRTPSTEMTFRKIGDDDVAVYRGMAAKGMGGSTEVTLVFKPAGRFELITSKPRGSGNFEIDGQTITLTYTDPAERPDGGAFEMTGSVSAPDVFAADTEVTIDLIEYVVVMETTPSVMDLGAVTFAQVSE